MKNIFNIIFLIYVVGIPLIGLSLDYSHDPDEVVVSYDKPQREIAIIATDEGYYPESFSVFKGERVRFFVTSTTEEPSCFMIPDHNIFLAANKGKITEGEVTFKKDGDIKFYCPAGKIKGKISVLSRKKEPARKIASEPQRKLWMPRDY